MKKIVSIVIATVCVIGIIGGCVFWYMSATKNPNNGQNENQNSGEIVSGDGILVEENSGEEQEFSPLFTLENYPKIDASLAIHPLVDSLASDFLGIPEDELDFEYTKTRTSDVYKRLIDGEVDAIFAAEASPDDHAYAESKGIKLNIRPVTSSAFVFIVNSSNPVDSLTLDQIIKILGNCETK